MGHLYTKFVMARKKAPFQNTVFTSCQKYEHVWKEKGGFIEKYSHLFSTCYVKKWKGKENLLKIDQFYVMFKP